LLACAQALVRRKAVTVIRIFAALVGTNLSSINQFAEPGDTQQLAV